MSVHPYKFKLLLDENLENPKLFPKLNNFHNVKHLVQDLHKEGINDSQVFQLAIDHERILITYNYKDFTKFPLSNSVGVIGISHSLTLSEIDKKLIAFLRKNSPKRVYGNRFHITGETK